LLERARYASASINFFLFLKYNAAVLNIYYFYILSNNILVITLYTRISMRFSKVCQENLVLRKLKLNALKKIKEEKFSLSGKIFIR